MPEIPAVGCSWLLFAVVARCYLSPLLSKSRRFCGWGQTVGCFFSVLSAVSAGGFKTIDKVSNLPD
jgi:hypothetical protein